MKRRRLLKVGMFNLLLFAGLPVACTRVTRRVERDGWILRKEDD